MSNKNQGHWFWDNKSPSEQVEYCDIHGRNPNRPSRYCSLDGQVLQKAQESTPPANQPSEVLNDSLVANEKGIFLNEKLSHLSNNSKKLLINMVKNHKPTDVYTFSKLGNLMDIKNLNSIKQALLELSQNKVITVEKSLFGLKISFPEVKKTSANTNGYKLQTEQGNYVSVLEASALNGIGEVVVKHLEEKLAEVSDKGEIYTSTREIARHLGLDSHTEVSRALKKIKDTGLFKVQTTKFGTKITRKKN
jgi:hypothetical protein